METGTGVYENFNYDFTLHEVSLLPPGPWGQDVICKGQNEKLLGFQRMTLT